MEVVEGIVKEQLLHLSTTSLPELNSILSDDSTVLPIARTLHEGGKRAGRRSWDELHSHCHLISHHPE